MTRVSYKKYLILVAALFVVLALPPLFVESIRGRLIACFSPFLKTKVSKKNEALERLEGENHLLRLEIIKLRTLLEQQNVFDSLAQNSKLPNLAPRRCEELGYLLHLQTETFPARVIYRDPASWSSSCWINVGESSNRQLGKKVIAKNSPVVVGRSVVGVVDYVGTNQSRVRLITDVSLKPSVRAVRGLSQNVALLEHLQVALRHFNSRSDLPLSTQEKGQLIRDLEKLKEGLSQEVGEWHLAKGVLQGAKAPLWRSLHQTLRGVGFNYDFSDREGPARELLTGKPVQNGSTIPTMPILKESDLLVTTGMDGIFPPGLRVAEVTKVFPLREGAYSYEIEAVPLVSNLDSLQTVFILPPLGFDPEVEALSRKWSIEMLDP